MTSMCDMGIPRLGHDTDSEKLALCGVGGILERDLLYCKNQRPLYR